MSNKWVIRCKIEQTIKSNAEPIRILKDSLTHYSGVESDLHEESRVMLRRLESGGKLSKKTSAFVNMIQSSFPQRTEYGKGWIGPVVNGWHWMNGASTPRPFFFFIIITSNR